ncbi:MAG: cob(I)yrinic acid a,c-diamide adenosyltransferase [Ignavibacteria bacterium]|jgi:cob(I)alamin adenosyltransferase
MKIYTKTGDKGETSLFGGQRVSKDNLRIEAYGTVDELNAYLGQAVAVSKSEAIKKVLYKIQNELFTVGADLATPKDKNIKKEIPRVNEKMVEGLENLIDEFDSKLPSLKNFVLPGGSLGASNLHIARTICRKIERRIVTLSNEENIGEYILKYLNRLSDLLFILARYENLESNTPDITWQN